MQAFINSAEAADKPRTIAGIKRLAKQLKKASEGQLQHMQALEKAARIAGHTSFKDAQHTLAPDK